MDGDFEWLEWIDGRSGIGLLREDPKSVHSLNAAIQYDDQLYDVEFSALDDNLLLDVYALKIEKNRIIFGLNEQFLKQYNFSNLFIAGDFNAWLSQGQDQRWQLKKTKLGKVYYWTVDVSMDDLPPSAQFKFVTDDWQWLPLSEFFANKIITGQNTKNLYYDETLLEKITQKKHILFELKRSEYRFVKPAKLILNEKCYSIDDRRYLASLHTDAPLGASVKDDQTDFSLFAPRAANVEVLWKSNLADDWSRISMKRQKSGFWFAHIAQNLEHCFYVFSITRYIDNELVTREVVDPYAREMVSQNGPGIIVNDVPLRQKKKLSKRDVVIYECHVRDLLANAKDILPEEKLNFRGLSKFVKYFKDLGVNAIELQPIQAFDHPENYHWGYMPINYFSLSNAYGTRADFRSFVETCHKYGLAVILDVVYNHLGDPNNLYAIDDTYYFRKNADGFLLNYSGCGNDLKTENFMTQRLISDSLAYFVKYYDVDGFRFDLAELVGLPLLEQLRKRLQKIKPELLMIAEPWSFRRYAGHDLKYTKLCGWNDEFRNFVKQYVCGNGNREGLRYFLRGSTDFRSIFLTQSVNYLSSHDDYCWIDSITEQSGHNGQNPTLNDIRRTHMALLILLLSRGIPMIAEGTELLHSKHGVENTYQRGDLNALNYDRRQQYSLTFDYIKSLIALRRRVEIFNQSATDYAQCFGAIENNSASAFLLNGNKEILLIALNPHDLPANFDIKLDKFRQIADTFTFGNTHYSIENNRLCVPPMSCGIWMKIP